MDEEGQSILDELELEQTQISLGVMARRVWLGARRDGASRLEAAVIVEAWFRSLQDRADDEL